MQLETTTLKKKTRDFNTLAERTGIVLEVKCGLGHSFILAVHSHSIKLKTNK